MLWPMNHWPDDIFPTSGEICSRYWVIEKSALAYFAVVAVVAGVVEVGNVTVGPVRGGRVVEFLLP